jgi:N-acetylglucosaminyldiphosphoundecaprenol N-acetyl-beta-D-mannosaminyltransferase
MSSPYRLKLLGVDVDVVRPDQVMDFVSDRVGKGVRTVIANHNLHSVYLFHRHPEMRALYRRADLIEIDSTPMIAWGRLLGYSLSTDHRCTYLDFRDTFWTLAQSQGWKVFHIGGCPEHTQASRDCIVGRYPGLHLGVHSGYFDTDGPENEALLAELEAEAPDIILIGMGMPRQEVWVERNYRRLPPSVILPVGGAFDYEAGVTFTPPRWTGRVGLEWLIRFVHDPFRLFGRYFIEPWSLVPLAVTDMIRHLRPAPERRRVGAPVVDLPIRKEAGVRVSDARAAASDLPQDAA